MTSHDPGGGTPVSVGTLADGRLDIRISKSWLETYRQCPEQARRRLVEPGADTSGCAAVLGTAAHLGIELTLREWQALGRVDVDVMERTWAEAMLWWHRQWGASNWADQAHHRISSSAHGAHLLADIANRWYLHVVPRLHPDMAAWRVEERCARVFVEGDRWRITLVGTVDLVTDGGCYDWKTGQVPPAWKMQRYDVQSTIYQLLTGQPLSLVYLPREHPEVVEIMKVDRHPGYTKALTAEVLTIADRIADVGLGVPWDRRPTDWHCSERWCPVFARGECMGAHLSIYPDEAIR